MSRSGRAAVILFLGIVATRLIWTGSFGWFVQQRMRIPLAAAAVVLLLFGIHELWRLWTEDADEASGHDHDHEHGHDHEDDHAHSHGAGPRVGWLLLLPVLVLISVAPTGLGAAAAQRVDAFVPGETVREFAPLGADGEEPTLGAVTRARSDELSQRSDEDAAGPAADDGTPLEVRVYEFIDRAVWDAERSLEDRVVRLEGLVVNDPDYPDGFKLTRFMVSCCAADGIPLQVAIRNAPEALADDTWVVADVVWRPPDVPYREQEGVWFVEADAVEIIPVLDGQPKDPYESPY